VPMYPVAPVRQIRMTGVTAYFRSALKRTSQTAGGAIPQSPPLPQQAREETGTLGQ